jgi:hypothetical protein
MTWTLVSMRERSEEDDFSVDLRFALLHIVTEIVKMRLTEGWYNATRLYLFILAVKYEVITEEVRARKC